MKRFIKQHKILSTILAIPLILLLAFSLFVAFLSITEFKPEPIQDAIIDKTNELSKVTKDNIKIMTFNIGFGGLGKESDFVLDGGKGAGADTISLVNKNMAGIKDIILDNKADIYMLQEIDYDSNRSFNIDQIDYYSKVLDGFNYSYAQNYVCKFVPYPFVRPMRDIDTGVITFNSFLTTEEKRISLPSPFSWPVSMANLKRCVLLSRMPIEGTDKELVLLNFHLEAYDDGAGKEAQTKLLLDILEEEYSKGNYVIAGGDFNQMFPEVDIVVKETSKWVPGRLSPLPDKFSDWDFIYDDSTPTCRLLNEPYDKESELTQYYVIDGFVTSPNIKVNSIKTLDYDFLYSDHNPVMLDITLD